ncbi:hypothetical protein FKM82_005523 [Ascaphus truei]
MIQFIKCTCGRRDSQRSHLSSFTMKLKDKFHSPKIKRTPSKKGKPADLTVKTEEKPVNKTLSRLEEQEKEVVNALRYFKTIVDKMAVDKMVLVMLPGSASKVLEAVLPLVQVDLHSQQSTAISSCYSRVYQSLANLIRWSDQVMLEGVNSEDKEVVATVRGVIKAVLDGVKELVRLMIEKQERPAPTTPVKPTLPACKTDGTPELPCRTESWRSSTRLRNPRARRCRQTVRRRRRSLPLNPRCLGSDWWRTALPPRCRQRKDNRHLPPPVWRSWPP